MFSIRRLLPVAALSAVALLTLSAPAGAAGVSFANGGFERIRLSSDASGICPSLTDGTPCLQANGYFVDINTSQNTNSALPTYQNDVSNMASWTVNCNISYNNQTNNPGSGCANQDPILTVVFPNVTSSLNLAVNPGFATQVGGAVGQNSSANTGYGSGPLCNDNQGGGADTACGEALYSPAAGGKIKVSPNGGNYVAADANGFFNVSFSQVVTGLLGNTVYGVSFYQAGSAQVNNGGLAGSVASQERWRVTFVEPTSTLGVGGGVPVNTPYSDPCGAIYGLTLNVDCKVSPLLASTNATTPWENANLTFKTAVNQTQATLTFLAVGIANGSPNIGPPIALLDGVQVTQCPEPSTMLLMGTGALGLVGYRKLRRRRS